LIHRKHGYPPAYPRRPFNWCCAPTAGCWSESCLTPRPPRW
jgi:hypothetical protein